MKRFCRATILVVLVLVLSLLVVVACDDKNNNNRNENNNQTAHTHTFSSDWQSDATYHWHNATCEHINEKSQMEVHRFTDDTCDVCHYKRIIDTTEISVDFYVDGVLYFSNDTINNAVVFPNDPQKSGFTFDGWYLDNNIWKNKVMNGTQFDSDSSVILYAHFKENIYKKFYSENDFSSVELELVLDEGWCVYTTSTSKSSQNIDVNSDVGYIESINGFVAEKDGSLSIVLCDDQNVYFEGGMKGQIFPDWINVSALRVKDNLIACKFANGEAGVFDKSGNTVLSRSTVSGASEANIDDVIKILDGSMIAVSEKYDTKPAKGFTSVYRPTTSGDVYNRGQLVCRVQNDDAKLSYMRGFDGKYVSVVGNSEGDYIFAIPQSASNDINIIATTNGTVENNGNDDYYSEITYMGNGKFFIHEDWTVSSTDNYAYYDGFGYYCFKRRIYTPDNDVTSEYTQNADKVFLYLENAYYGGDKGGVDCTQYINNEFTYACYGLSIIDKVGVYDQFILDENFNIVMSLKSYYKTNTNSVGRTDKHYDLLLHCVDGYYYCPFSTNEIIIWDENCNIVGNNSISIVEAQLSNGIIIAKIINPDDENSYLYGAMDVKGKVIIPFEYSSLSAFRDSYTIGMKYDSDAKRTLPYIIGSDGNVVTEMSDGTTPLGGIALTSSAQLIYKNGCYMYRIHTTDENGKDVSLFGIKNFNPNVNENVVMPATMESGSALYASSKCPNRVFAFAKNTNGTSATYKIYRLI